MPEIVLIKMAENGDVTDFTPTAKPREHGLFSSFLPLFCIPQLERAREHRHYSEARNVPVSGFDHSAAGRPWPVTGRKDQAETGW